MKKIEMYCVTNKVVEHLHKTNYNIGWVGKEKSPRSYVNCADEDNIFFKEKYYSELTFHYWYWKNRLNLQNVRWIGFCQKRRFWIKKKSTGKKIDYLNFRDHILDDLPTEFLDYDSILCNPINVNNVKKSKLFKRGFRSIIKDPSIIFNTNKQNLLLHFDMHHGYGNMEKAIKLINVEDRVDFLDYLKNSTSFNPNIMFIAKSSIANKWFNVLFPWLLRCEKVFGFSKLSGYDTQRLYAYLAERYLSFWFKKHTNYLNWPWTLVDFDN
jgi:hypothetical protein